jgi:hypothetical protein
MCNELTKGISTFIYTLTLLSGTAMGYSGQGHSKCRLSVAMCQCRPFSICHLTNSVDQNTSYKSYQSLSLLRNGCLLIGPDHLVCFRYIIVNCPHKGDNKDNNNNRLTKYSGTSVHERLSSRTNRFTNAFHHE